MAAPTPRKRCALSRHLNCFPAQFQSAKTSGAGRVKKLRKGGLFIETEALPNPGDEVSVIFETPDGKSMVVSGTVRWITAWLQNAGKMQPGFGMQIDPLPKRYSQFFRKLVLH